MVGGKPSLCSVRAVVTTPCRRARAGLLHPEDLADGDGLALVAQREPAQLGMRLEGLHADRVVRHEPAKARQVVPAGFIYLFILFI